MGSLIKPTTRNFSRWTALTFSQASTRSDRYGAFTRLETMPSWFSRLAASNSSARRLHDARCDRLLHKETRQPSAVDPFRTYGGSILIVADVEAGPPVIVEMGYAFSLSDVTFSSGLPYGSRICGTSIVR